MKKLFILTALLTVSVGLMAQTTTSIDGIKYPYVKEEKKITTVTFPSLNIVLNIEGSNAVNAVTLALKNYLATKPQIPVITKPDFSVPSGSYKELALTSSKNIDLGDLKDSNIKFKPGVYKNILISSKSLKNVNLDFSGSNFEGCTFVFEKGNNVKVYGLNTKNQDGTIQISFYLNNFQLISSSVVNCGNSPVTFFDKGRALPNYNGTEATLNKGFKVLNTVFDNSEAIVLDGHLDDSRDDGLFKDVEIAYNTFKNSPSTGKVVSATNIWNYDIHHNYVDNINTTNNNHNGVFELHGNGKFYSNRLTNYQGNSIRAWLFSRGNTSQTIEIYNNICFNTSRYSGFEIQEMNYLLQPGKTSFANAKVYNNTVGRMNTGKPVYFEGQVLDLYNISGSLQYYNNLGFELNRQSNGGTITNMITYNGNSKPELDYSKSLQENKYFQNWQDAVIDLISFKSKIAGVGAQ